MAVEAPRIGLDLVAVPRVRGALAGREERWQRRVFTAREWKSADEGPDRDASLAVCFAAKEAAFKALGTGWGGGVAWQDVELCTGPQSEAALALTGRAAELASEADITLTVSVSHTDELAVAMVLGQ